MLLKVLYGDVPLMNRRRLVERNRQSQEMAGHFVEQPRGVTANVVFSGVDRIDFSVGSRCL
jgi:hypothetical protein